MKIKEAIDTIFSHNEVVAIWEESPNDHRIDELKWHGMAHKIPHEYLVKENWRIFGVITDEIRESDRINIRIVRRTM